MVITVDQSWTSESVLNCDEFFTLDSLDNISTFIFLSFTFIKFVLNLS